MSGQPEKMPFIAFRFESLGDAIFAVAATLLILDIHLPEGGKFENVDSFWIFVRHVAPNVISYFVSFLILGIMWFGHRAMFEYIERTNRYFIFTGFVFYALICFVPFSTKLIASDPLKWYTILVYGVNLSLCNISLYMQWRYALRHPALLRRDPPPDVKLEAKYLFLLSPVVYSGAIILSFWYPSVSLAVFVVTPVLYLLPNKLDRYMH